jgi:molybdenum cofactor cytidylyltransferase
VVNPQPERGVLSSVAVGIEKARDADGYLLMPVDHPYIQVETLRVLAEAFQADPAKIVKPVCLGRGGHPVILPREFARRLPASDVPGGLRALMAQASAPVRGIVVDDPGVLVNVNEPGDLEP